MQQLGDILKAGPPGSQVARALPERAGAGATRAVVCATCGDSGCIPGPERASWEGDRVEPSVSQCPACLSRAYTRIINSWPQGTLEGFEVRGRDRSIRRAYQAAVRFVEAPEKPWLVFWGPSGVGKTHLAAGVLRARARRVPPQVGVFWAVPELLDWLRGGVREDAASGLDARMQPLYDCDLLVLDDLGAARATEWALERMQEIVDARYRHRRETIITLDMVAESLPPRMADRMMDHRIAWTLALEGPSYRTGKAWGKS